MEVRTPRRSAASKSILTLQRGDEIGLAGLARHLDSPVGTPLAENLAGQEAQILLRLRSRLDSPVRVSDARLATELARLPAGGFGPHTLASGAESLVGLGKVDVEHGVSLGYTTE